MEKKKIILTGKHGRPSSKLAWVSSPSIDNLTLIQKRNLNGRKYYRLFNNKNIDLDVEEFSNNIKYQKRTKLTDLDNKLNLENSIVIRWGTIENILTNNKTVVYNKIEAIKNATNKKLSRELFIKNNVNTPNLYTIDSEDLTYPIIARPLIHSKGKNFIILNNYEEFSKFYDLHEDDWYYSEFIDKDREFRVHVAHNKVLAVMEKVKPNNGNIAWNRAQNETEPFIYVSWNQLDDDKLKNVLLEAIKAVEALELDMGGVDVMLKDDTAYVLEVNTAPTLNSSPYVAKRWGLYWNWLLSSDVRRKKWNYNKLKKSKSLMWKNFQLEIDFKIDEEFEL